MKFWGSILFYLFLSINTIHTQVVTDSLYQYLTNQEIPIEEKIQLIEDKVASFKKTKPASALMLLDSSIQLLLPLHSPKLGGLYFLRGDLHTKLGNTEIALQDFEKAKKLLHKNRQYKELSHALNRSGWIYIREGKYEQGRKQFRSALRYAERERLDKQIAINQNDIGVSYHYQKNYEEAIDYYLKSTILREEIGDEQGLVISYNNLGVIYKLNEDHTSAFKYYTKGKILAESIPDSSRLASFNINIGRLYFDSEQLPMAIPYFEKALTISEAIVDKRKMALSLYNLGEVYRRQEKYEPAIEHFEAAIQYFQELGQEKNIIGTLYKLGVTYSSLGNFKKGLSLMLDAEKRAKQTDIVFVDELQDIANAYSQLDRPIQAYQYLEKYGILKDSLESIQLKERISAIQTEYETAFHSKEKEQELILLNQEKKYIQKILLFSICFTVLTLGLIMLLFFYYRKKQRLNELLTTRNQTIQSKNQKLKQLNKDLSIAKEISDKAVKAKEQFLASMSHEIRTPMNAVIGMTNILIDETPREDQLENLYTLKFSAKNLLTLINYILDFSKMESGKVKLEIIDFSLITLLNNVLETFRLSKQKREVLLLLQEEGIRQLKYQLKGDPTRLTQIFTNLLGNALKFTESGHVKLIARLVAQNSKSVTIHFAVEDTGIGIPKDKWEHIFQSFTQAADSTTRLYGGTGLGLAITKNLVELHDSTIHMTSEVGVGSTFAFEISFPLGQPTPQSTVRQLENDISTKRGLENRKILLVEDNKINQLVAMKILSKWKVRVDIAADGLEALELLKHNDYDIILMDIQMPRMNGYEATRAIRAMNSYKSKIPIIALTASNYGIAENAIANGMDDFVTKPFQPNELHERISRLIQAREKEVSNPGFFGKSTISNDIDLPVRNSIE